MGYYSRVEGEITITPPLTLQEMRAKPYGELRNTGDRWPRERDVALRVESEEVDTAEGLLIKKRGVALIPASDDSYKAYYLKEDVQDAIDQYPGHTFSGYLESQGEDGELSRVVVKDGVAHEIKPEIVWPEV